MTRNSSPIARLAAGCAVALLSSVVVSSAAAQAPAAGTPTLTIDVQVVDREGAPVGAIAADKFQVEIGGRRREVIGAEVVSAAPAQAGADVPQMYFVAVDALTFGPGGNSGAIEATTALVRSLPANSYIGLVTFPQGPAVEPTLDRDAVVAALPGIAGQRPQPRTGQFALGVSDVIEYTSSADPLPIVQRFCGAELSEDSACPQLLAQEISAVVNNIEAQARASLGMLADFASRLGAIPGRKVLMLVTAGLPIGERSGSRPEVGNLPTQLAEAATGADVAVYTMLLDRLQDADSGSGRQSANAGRDRAMLGRWLEQFSLSMGGALVRVQTATDTETIGRIAGETASFYRLVVASTDADATARPQRLRVRVDQRGAVVRSRNLVRGR